MSTTPPTVLLIDDNPDILLSFATSLTKYEGFIVATAADGVQGLERYYETRPDCVVIDVRMPEIDGLQLTRALRGDAETAATPLIILTALNQDADRLAALLSGADHYLVKPVKPSQLAEIIRDVIARNAADRAEQREVHTRALLEEDDPHTS